MDRLDSVRTVRQFDECYTAPHFRFNGADDYYHRASAMRVIDRIRVPALIISAEDDPFVPAETFAAACLRANPHITLIMTPHGGHCGFASDANGDDDGYWAETQIVDFAERVSTTLEQE
jgi:predicted alpha/beta-fold hydrolase